MSQRALELQLAAVEEEIELICGGIEEDALRGRLGAVMELLERIRLAFASPDSDGGRRDLRAELAVITTMDVAGVKMQCAIKDLSRGGALIDTDDPLEVGTIIQLKVPEAGFLGATIVAKSPEGLHVAFRNLSAAQEIAVIEDLKNRYASR